MIFSQKAIVINTTRTGEGSLVIHTIGSGFGRCSFITGVSRKTPMALFQPMSIVDMEVIENSKSELWRIRNLRQEYPLSGIRGNLHKNTITMFLSEVLFRTLKEGAFEEGLFDWCVGSILTLDALEGDFANYHLRFLMEFATALGFAPSIENLGPFADGHLAELKQLLSASFPEFMLIPMSGRTRNEMAESLLRYIGFHAETSLNIRSLAVLRELYA